MIVHRGMLLLAHTFWQACMLVQLQELGLRGLRGTSAALMHTSGGA